MFALSGFEHVNRYVDGRDGALTAKLKPGEYYVSTGRERLVTVAGATVAVVLHDEKVDVLGMAHFSLPLQQGMGRGDYGRHALDLLIGGLIRNGAGRGSMRATILGGGRMSWEKGMGEDNVTFACEQLQSHGIRIWRQITGSVTPQKFWFHPATHAVTVEQIRPCNDTVLWREFTYLETLTRVWKERDLFFVDDMLQAHTALLRRLDFLLSCTKRLDVFCSRGGWAALQEAVVELVHFLDDHFCEEERVPPEAWVSSPWAQRVMLKLQLQHGDLRRRAEDVREGVTSGEFSVGAANERIAELIRALRAHERAEHSIVSADLSVDSPKN